MNLTRAQAKEKDKADKADKGDKEKADKGEKAEKIDKDAAKAKDKKRQAPVKRTQSNRELTEKAEKDKSNLVRRATTTVAADTKDKANLARRATVAASGAPSSSAPKPPAKGAKDRAEKADKGAFFLVSAET